MGSAISFPPNLYTYININNNISSEKWIINYSKSERVNNPNKIKNDIAREVIKYFNLPPISMTFNSDIPSSGSGLASSSSYMIACIAAACKFKGIDYSQTEIAKLAIKLERSFNPLTGYQDPYGCALGGLKQFIFYPDYILQENLSTSIFNNYNLFLVPTGITSLLLYIATQPQEECLVGSGVAVGSLKPIIFTFIRLRNTIINIYR